MLRSENAEAHERLWQTRFAEGSTIRFEVVKIDQPQPGVALAIVQNHNDYIESGKPQSHDSIISLVLLETDEGWRIRQFSNNLILR